MKDNF